MSLVTSTYAAFYHSRRLSSAEFCSRWSSRNENRPVEVTLVITPKEPEHMIVPSLKRFANINFTPSLHKVMNTEDGVPRSPQVSPGPLVLSQARMTLLVYYSPPRHIWFCSGELSFFVALEFGGWGPSLESLGVWGFGGAGMTGRQLVFYRGFGGLI